MWHSLRLAIVAVGLLALLGATALAQSPGADQVEPSVRGNMIVWSQSTATGHRLMAREILENGLPRRGPTGTWVATNATRPDGTTGAQRWPMALSDYLAWSELAPGRQDHDVFLQRLDSRGRPEGEPILVAGGPSDQIHPTIGGACGELLVLWADDRRDDGDIFGQWYNSRNLEPRGPAVWVVDSPGHADEPVVDFGQQNVHTLRILFTDDRNGNLDIYARTIRDDSKPPIDPRAEQEPVIAGPLDEFSPRIARAGSQDLLIWTVDTLSDGPDVVGQRHFVNHPRGRPMVIAGGPGAQRSPALSGYVDYGWLVAWTTDTGGGPSVIGAEIRANGLMGPRRIDLRADHGP